MRLEKLSHVSPKMGTKTPKYPKVMETNEVSIEGVQKKNSKTNQRKPILASFWFPHYTSGTITVSLFRGYKNSSEWVRACPSDLVNNIDNVAIMWLFPKIG